MISGRQKGLFLISVLLVMMFLVMFASALVVFAGQAIHNANAVQNDARARNAALSGMEYAKMRLMTVWGSKGTQAWTGGDKVKKKDFILNSGTLHVTEHYNPTTGLGWVEGATDADSQAKFFIYFAPPTSLSFKDSVVGDVTARYRSINNFSSFTASADNTTFDNKTYRTVPPLAANIIVQGRCGTAEEHVETMIFVLPDEKYQALMTVNGDTNLPLQNNQSEWLIGSNCFMAPEVRIGGDLNVNTSQDKLVSKNPVDMLSKGIGLVGNAINFDSRYTIKPEDINFMEKLGFDKALPGGKPTIASASSAISDKSKEVKIKAGTYIFKKRTGWFEDKVRVYYVRSDDPKDSSLGSCNWDGSSWFVIPHEVRDRVNELRGVMDCTTDDTYITGFKLKKKIKIEPATKWSGFLWWGHEKVVANDIRIISDTPYIPSMELKSGNYIRNEGGSIYLDSQIGGDGGLYAKKNVEFCGQNQLQTNDSLNIVAQTGHIKIDPSIKIEYRLTEPHTEYDTEKKEYKTTYVMNDYVMNRVYNQIMEHATGIPKPKPPAETPPPEGEETPPPEPPAPPESPNGEPGEFISQAILEYIKQEKDNKVPCMITSEYFTIGDILDTEVKFEHKGKAGKKTSLEDYLEDKFDIDRHDARGLIKKLLDANSRSYEGEYYNYFVVDKTHLAIFKQIATGKIRNLNLKVDEERTHVIKGLIYAGADFIANLGTDSLTVEGAIFADKVNVNAGNFNTFYDLGRLKALYNLGDNTYKEAYRTTLDR